MRNGYCGYDYETSAVYSVVNECERDTMTEPHASYCKALEQQRNDNDHHHYHTTATRIAC